MKLHRKAFTLIEMMIAISILSIMMLYLYKTYADLNISNNNLHTESSKIEKIQKIKEVISQDFMLSLVKSTKIVNREKNEDFITLQTTHSIHRRYNPYVTYIVKDKKLYRLESLKKIATYEMPSDTKFDIDYLGEVTSFRVYKSTNNELAYLISLNFKKMKDILLKVKPLNEY